MATEKQAVYLVSHLPYEFRKYIQDDHLELEQVVIEKIQGIPGYIASNIIDHLKMNDTDNSDAAMAQLATYGISKESLKQYETN